MLRSLSTLFPLLIALPALAFPGVAAASPARDCFDPSTQLTVEEQRLTVSLPLVNTAARSASVEGGGGGMDGGPAVGPELVRLAGFDRFVSRVKAELCVIRTPWQAERLARAAGDELWRTAVDRAQGRRPDLGTLDRYDDRPLYWARLELSAALRQWTPRFTVPADLRTRLLTAFDHGSRGLDDVHFPIGHAVRRLMVSGFDPFQLTGLGIRISNPAGAAALQLDGRVLQTPSGPALVQAVTFPVVWGYFDQGIVEAAYGSVLRDRSSWARPDVIMTISQGRPGRFDIERWAGDWRGGFPDNNNASSVGPVPPAAGWPQPDLQFIETTLPVRQMLAAPAGAYPVNFNLAFCVWPDSAHPGTGTAVCRNDAPAPGEIAASGGGGNYLSNESMYRSNRVRLGLGAASVAGGHLHTPVLGQPTAPTDLTDADFEARRHAIADQVVTLATAAATTPTTPTLPNALTASDPFATVLSAPGTVLAP